MGLLSLLGDVSAVGTGMSSFTPAAAAIGGTVLGLASAGKLVMTGRILGISGAFKGLVRGDTSAWRFAFLGGMAAGAVAAAATMPGAFEVLPHTFTLTRSALGGLLVGFGAAMGNGCTSGHGICGNARFSIRSMVNTLCFMASGALTATRTNTAAAAGLNTGHAAALDMPNPQILMELAMLPATTLGTFIILGLLGKKASQQSHKKESARGGSSFLKFTELLSEAAAGFYFSQGLALSGMVRPSKVAAFLSPTIPAWDPSLMFVMAAGLAVATPAFQGVFRGWFPAASHKPIVCDRYNMPELSTLEWKLVLGGLVFGVGWGLTGMCPGPAIVSLIVPGVQNVVFVATMLLGMVIETATCG